MIVSRSRLLIGIDMATMEQLNGEPFSPCSRSVRSRDWTGETQTAIGHMGGRVLRLSVERLLGTSELSL